jgi:hypothetical protein
MQRGIGPTQQGHRPFRDGEFISRLCDHLDRHFSVQTLQDEGDNTQLKQRKSCSPLSACHLFARF